MKLDGYEWFTREVKKRYNIDLTLYKEDQMKRRLSSLATKSGAGSFQEFFKQMQADKPTEEACLDRMTINVSEFFRNRGRWEVFETKILPDLLNNRKGTLKIWSAACSTGEEPYTLSIILSRYLEPHQFSIQATDLDQKVLAAARAGIYQSKSLRELDEKDIRKYFKQRDNEYLVKDTYKQSVTFSRHNLLKDDYGKAFDLIVCRNVLIYFTDPAKTAIYKNFGEALVSGGFLFVGSTEQIFQPGQFDFDPVDHFFYQKTTREDIRC